MQQINLQQINIRIVIVIALIAAALGGVVGVLGFIWFVGGDAAPSTTLVAPTLDINAQPTEAPDMAFTQLAQANAENAALRTQVSLLSTQVATGMAITADPPMPTAAPTQSITAPVESNLAERRLYRIDQRDSRVTFTMTETLQGARNTVIGGTDQVAGDVIIDFDNPAQSQVGTIRINARTLVTDNEFRNRALRAEILRTSQDEFEFIEFVPQQVNGLPEMVTVGSTYSFEIVGDLTILNTTNSVTFAAEVTIDAADTISGTASATMLYADWGISIPDAPGVADVTDDATLAIEFVARAVEE